MASQLSATSVQVELASPPCTPRSMTSETTSVRIDEDGIFSVGAKDIETGEEKVIDVLASSGLSDDEIAQMMEDSAEYLAHRRAQEAAEKNRQLCLVAIKRIQNRLPEAEKRMAWTPVGANAVKKARQAVQRVEESLADADAEQVEKHLDLLVRVETMIEKVMAKTE